MENYIIEIKGYIEDLKTRLEMGNYADKREMEELEWNLEGWEMELERLKK